MSVRRLAAIVVFDVVGYSRMMAEDEDGTHSALKAHRTELDPILLNHGGRIVKGTGDGLLVEVPSAVEAVKASIEAQRLMTERNAVFPEGRRMQFRIEHLCTAVPEHHEPQIMPVMCGGLAMASLLSVDLDLTGRDAPTCR